MAIQFKQLLPLYLGPVECSNSNLMHNILFHTKIPKWHTL